MRSGATAVISCLLAAACSQLLGIDGRYSRDEAPPASSAGPDMIDAGAGGSPDQPHSSAGGAGGTQTEAQMPLVLPPAVPGMPPHPARDAGHLACAEGYKVCSDLCMTMTPEHGCGGPRCDPCVSHANAHTSCGKDGACESICNAGFMPAGSECVPQMGTGGAPGAGGTPPSVVKDAGASGARSSEPGVCNPLECPTCNRGFEGCCIPSGPDGTPSRCGCFYFPPLCTARVPG